MYLSKYLRLVSCTSTNYTFNFRTRCICYSMLCIYHLLPISLYFASLLIYTAVVITFSSAVYICSWLSICLCVFARSRNVSVPKFKHKTVDRCAVIYIYIYIYRMSQEECAILREGVPYVKVYRYSPKHLCPKLNGYGDNGQRSLKLWQLLHTYWLPTTY